MPFRLVLLLVAAAPWVGRAADPPPPTRPNVILIVTDDQGYGDLACHGNTVIRTPNLDRLHAESVRLTDFHVDPTCSPTRAALTTGRYSTRTGVWHTIMGRSILRAGETTLPELFAQAGYRTAMVGKWHLGDNAPNRPEDRGFGRTLVHRGGGVGQTPDWWGNDYFDDTCFRDGVPEAQTGYCTDVFFAAATDFIDGMRQADTPFFCYVSTNAPHGPFRVPDRYSQPYRDAGVPDPMADFYGMIENIDENVGRLRRRLDEWGIAENTLLVFLTDNGTAAGFLDPHRTTGRPQDRWTGFNAGMRGAKGSAYDGGHRVPCFWHWPAAGWTGGRDVDALSAHIDVLPTLRAACGLPQPPEPIDGIDLSQALSGDGGLPGRTLLVHSQRIWTPEKWRNGAVMTDRWRLIDGERLYDIVADPDQSDDLAGQRPQAVADLRAAYDRWWQSLAPAFDGVSRINLGDPREPAALLTCHDWQSERVPWNQDMVRKDPQANGTWHVRVVRAGRYRFRLRTRPPGIAGGLPLTGGDAAIQGIGDGAPDWRPQTHDDELVVEMPLPAGEGSVRFTVGRADGTRHGPYFVVAERIGERP